MRRNSNKLIEQAVWSETSYLEYRFRELATNKSNRDVEMKEQLRTLRHGLLTLEGIDRIAGVSKIEPNLGRAMLRLSTVVEKTIKID